MGHFVAGGIPDLRVEPWKRGTAKHQNFYLHMPEKPERRHNYRAWHAREIHAKPRRRLLGRAGANNAWFRFRV